jgi:hypothetical protein
MVLQAPTIAGGLMLNEKRLKATLIAERRSDSYINDSGINNNVVWTRKRYVPKTA